MDPENLTCDCGKCSCKTNFVGDTCNECEIGYHDFPNCKGIHFQNSNRNSFFSAKYFSMRQYALIHFGVFYSLYV